jgi:NAD(P)-dependent dehydrogenase (short-subunit alcohol dehydrogenase family)
MSAKLDCAAIITGAAGGLGSVMTLALLEGGARVAAADIPAAESRMAQLAAAAERIGARDRLFPVYGDVSVYADCKAMVDATVAHFGAVHVLVNNAALFINSFTDHVLSAPPPFTGVPVEMWTQIIGINVNGPFYMAHVTAPHLIAQKWGRIINLVTSYGTMTRGGVSPYGQSKAALEAGTSIWSADLAGTGVTVNALLPGGAADTAMIPVVDRADRSTLVNPSVMAAPIVWLASRDSDGTTGRRIIAKDWDPAAPSAEALRKASTPAAWRTE